MTWAINPTSSLDASVGYQIQNYFNSVNATYTYGLSGAYMGYSRLTLRPYVLRSINETALTNYSNYVSTIVGVDFTYEIHDAWPLTGGLNYNTAVYAVAPGANAPPRTDTYMRAQLGVLYSLRPQVSIGPVFEYIKGDSTDPINGAIYDRQTIAVRLTTRR